MRVTNNSTQSLKVLDRLHQLRLQLIRRRLRGTDETCSDAEEKEADIT